MAEKQKAVIIGSGVAGLASAIRLAVLGFEVAVYEKNDYLGGKLSHFGKDGFRFDTGPSLFTQPEYIETLFKLANEPISEYFEYEAMPISCKYFYEDGIIINAFTNTKDFAEEVSLKLGENKEHLIDYLQEAKAVYENIGNIFLNYSLHKFDTLLNAPISKGIKAVKAALLFKTLHQINKSSFKHPHLVQLFDRYATFNGSNPYQAPGMLRLIPHLDNNIGTFYPKGGMIAITNALVALAKKKGVTFKLNSEATKIETKNNQAIGVVVDEKLVPASVIVSNMDVYFTYKYLMGNENKAASILKQERSSSAFIFYWGINKTYPQLELHNIFFTKDYESEFNALFKEFSFYSDPTVYINITSKCEPNLHAPSGKENWFVMVNAPANHGQDWQHYYQLYRKAIIEKLNRLLNTDLENIIEVEEILSPLLIENKTASYMGSLYGTSSNGKMAAFFRHPNFSNSISNLYFVGGSVHPGGGIPLCLQSAAIMSKMIEKDYQLP